MLGLTDLDSNFIKCIGFLHASDSLTVGDQVPLQSFLEEAIKNKTGHSKDLTHFVTGCLKQRRVDDLKINYEESKQSNSDNELELDLLKEDLMCIVCKFVYFINFI